jgi:hypothetical protein
LLYRPLSAPLQIPLRHRCRNPRCRGKLETPAENERDAFCCSSCYAVSRALVRLRGADRAENRQSTPVRAEEMSERISTGSNTIWGGRYRGTGPRHSGPKSSAKSKPKTGIKVGRAWRIVAGPDLPAVNLQVPLEPELADRLKRFHADLSRATGRPALFQRRTPPANVIGGYRFPGAPAVGLSPTEPATNAALAVGAERLIRSVPTDLSIPDFLKRTVSAASRPAAEVRPTPCLEPAPFCQVAFQKESNNVG